jgi:signal transduction histidine kinase
MPDNSADPLPVAGSPSWGLGGRGLGGRGLGLPGWRWLLGAAVVALLYSLGYLLLDRVSTFDSVQGTEISPWEPAIPLLMYGVIEFGLPIVPLAIMLPWLAEIVNRDAHPFGVPALAAIACIGCAYTGMGLFLRLALRRYPINSITGFTLLLATLAVGALAGSALYAMALLHDGALRAESLPVAVVTDWIGDMSGVVAVLPLVLLLRSSEGPRWHELRSRMGELLLQLLVLGLVFSATFGWLATTRLQLFYLFFVPVIWIALRFGDTVTAIAVALLQASVVLVLATRATAQPLVAIQLLILVLACTGLFMGIAVTTSNRLARLIAAKDEQLALVNRATGIMELNSAIAHELNNPLAAVSNYLRATTLLLERPDTDQQLVHGTVHKALGEASRAVEVLGKLRAFYRGGVVQHQQLAPRALGEDALATQQTKLRQRGIACELHCDPAMADIEADAIQLSVVLQNLLANACDAVGDLPPIRRRIALHIERRAGEVLFTVADRGEGIPPAARTQLFWPLSSSKPAGMGLGLAISRSLVEANGGRIWLERSDSDGTRISFSVPVWSPVVQEHIA